FDLRALCFGQLKIDIVAQLESDYLARQNFRTRTELDKLHLAFGVVQNFCERVVDEAKLGAIEAKRDREFQFLRRASVDQRLMKLPIMREVARIAVNRLLKITDHREMTCLRSCHAGAVRRRRRLSILEPFARRVRRPRDFEKNKELLRIGVLSLVENDPVILFTNTLCDVWQTEQFSSERDLIGIGDRPAGASKIAI